MDNTNARRRRKPQTPADLYRVVRAAAHDAGNRSCREAGRCVWTREDANAAADEQTRLMIAFNLLNGSQFMPEGYSWQQIEGEWVPMPVAVECAA